MQRAARRVWILLWLIGGSAAVADYKGSYAKGLEALEDGHWTEAAEWFRQAIAEKPEAGGKVNVSGKNRWYVPYHQLALALYFGDALEEAEQAWAKSAAQGVVARKMPRSQKLAEQYRADIAVRLEERSPSAPEASSEPSAKEIGALRLAVSTQLQRAARQLLALDEPRRRSRLDADAALAQGRDMALEKFRQARQIYEERGEDASGLSEAHALAVEAAASLEALVLKVTR